MKRFELKRDREEKNLKIQFNVYLNITEMHIILSLVIKISFFLQILSHQMQQLV